MLVKAQKQNNAFIILSLIMATILWYVMFVIKPINFWVEMSISILILVITAFLSGYRFPQLKKIEFRHVVIGVVSAVILYFVFYVGNIVSGYLFPFKDAQVLSVYSNRSQGSLVWIGLLLLFIIGPGEEIFWRGLSKHPFQKGLEKIKVISLRLYYMQEFT